MKIANIVAAVCVVWMMFSAAQAQQQAQMAVIISQPGIGLIVAGRTNLPRGTSLLISLQKPSGALYAQEDATVGEFGRFYVGPFSNGEKRFRDGRYQVSVSGKADTTQDDKIRKQIGENWRNFTGPLITTDKWGTTFELIYTFDYKNYSNKTLEVFAVGPKGASISPPPTSWVRSAVEARVKAREAKTESMKADAYSTCRWETKQRLRDPESAQFINVSALDSVRVLGTYRYEVTHIIRANNGFGGKTVARFRCRVHFDSNWVVESIKEFDA